MQRRPSEAKSVRSPQSSRQAKSVSRSDPSFGRLSPPPPYSQIEADSDGWKAPAKFVNPPGLRLDLDKKGCETLQWKGPNLDGNLNGIKIDHVGEAHGKGTGYPVQPLQVNMAHTPLLDSEDITAQLQQLNAM